MTIHCQAGRGVVVCCIAVTASLCSQLHRANAAEPPTENSKTTATAATTLPATTESREQAKRIGEVMQSLVQDEADAVQAGKQDPSQSLRTLENLEKRMVSIDAAGCPDDFRIEFLRCTHGLDKIVLHSQDVLAAMKLQHDQMGEEFVKAIITHAVPLALLIPKGASSDPLAEKKDAILKDRDQYLDSREKLTEMTIKYHVTVPAPVAHVAQAPITGKETVTIRRGKLYNLPLSFEPNITPGRLTGHWESEGKSAHLRGANDDTIVAFTIRDSKNARVVQQLHTVSGKFDARYDGGVYTLTFSNADLLRSSARNITIEWTYQPD